MKRIAWTLALLAAALPAAAQETQFSQDGISFSAPEGFKIRKSDFQYGWEGTLAEIEGEAACGALTITDSEQDAKAWGEARLESWKGLDGVSNFKQHQLKAEGNRCTIEYSFEYEGMEFHYLQVLVSKDQKIVELALWCAGESWNDAQKAIESIAGSLKAGAKEDAQPTTSNGGGSASAMKVPEHYWKDFGVGTKLVYKMIVECAGTKMESTVTHELVKKDDSSFSVKVTTEMPNIPKTETTMEYVVDKNASANGQGQGGAKVDVKKGNESIKVEAGEFECEWIETDFQGNKSKAWSSKKVPGGLVKSVGESASGKSTMELVKIDKK